MPLFLPNATRSFQTAIKIQKPIGALAGILGLLAVACSSSEPTGNPSPDADAGPQPDSATGDPNILVGTFQVRLVAPVPAMDNMPETPGYTSVVGKIYDGPSPSQIIWEEVTKEGDCKLSTPRVPFCSTPCGGSAACVEDDKCQDYPLAHSAGTVTITGLLTETGPTEVAMNPVVNTYQPTGLKLLYPPFKEGDAVTVSASGDYYRAFSIAGKGIAPLELLNDTITLEPDKPVNLTWKAPGQADIAAVRVKLDISHHGGTKGMIECAAKDTGALEISGALIKQLMDLGVAGFPSVILTRESVASTTIAEGRVDLAIASGLERFVVIPGLTSCTDTANCPDGQTCQSDLTCK
jgi:hypothetical protein